MGYGSYSTISRSTRAENLGYTTKSVNEIFESKHLSSEMNPHDLVLRESRDSKEHPNSLPIIIALDVTGSMGSIPHNLVKQGLPNMMSLMLEKGILDPQILFLGIGDHECDRAPLQVGQFESSDELLDKWLTTVYLEGGGGANDGESYLLAWYLASRYTITDHWEVRKKKGYLFTIGDEPTLKRIPVSIQQSLMGNGQYREVTAEDILEEVQEKYHVYHLHISETSAGRIRETVINWKTLLGSKNVIEVQNKNDVSNIVSRIITENEQTANAEVIEQFNNLEV